MTDRQLINLAEQASRNAYVPYSHFAVGAALGLLFGVMLNGCGLWEDHALGIAIGPLWGMAIAAMDGRGRPKEKKRISVNRTTRLLRIEAAACSDCQRIHAAK